MEAYKEFVILNDEFVIRKDCIKSVRYMNNKAGVVINEMGGGSIILEYKENLIPEIIKQLNE